MYQPPTESTELEAHARLCHSQQRQQYKQFMERGESADTKQKVSKRKKKKTAENKTCEYGETYLRTDEMR